MRIAPHFFTAAAPPLHQFKNLGKKSTNTGFSDIKKFVEEFQKIGQTPRKSAGKILKDFEETVYSFTKKNKLKKEEVFQIEKALKSSFLSNSSDPDKAFIDEKNRLNRLINSTIKETTQLENNLSFFSNTKGKMFEDFEQKITNNKEIIHYIERRYIIY